VLEDTAIEHHLGEPRHVLGGAEEAGMRGDAAERVRVLVVHFAAQDAAPPRIVLRRRDARMKRRRRTVTRVVHPQRAEDALLRERLEIPAGHALEHLAEQDLAQVGVDRLRPRLEERVHGLDVAEVGVLALQLLVQVRDASGLSAGVREQVAHGDLVPEPALEIGQERRHRLVEIELPLVDEDHRHGGGHDDLGQAGQVVDRLLVHGSGVRVVRQLAVRLQEDEGAIPARRRDPARERATREGVVDHGVDLGDEIGAEAGLFRPRTAQRHLAAGNVEAMAMIEESGDGDGQLPSHRILAKEGADRRALARFGAAVGAQVHGDLRHLAQQVRAAEGDENHGTAAGGQRLQQPRMARCHVHVSTVRADAHERGSNDVRVPGGHLHHLRLRLCRHFRSEGDGLRGEPPRQELVLGPALDELVAQVARHHEVEDLQRDLGAQRQNAAFVLQHRDRAARDLHRLGDVFGTRHDFGQAQRVDPLLPVKAEALLRGQDPEDGDVDPLLGQLLLAYGADEGLDGDIWIRGKEDHVRARPHGADRRLARPCRAHPRHLHGIGHDEAVEAELGAEQVGGHRSGQRRRRVGRVEGGDRDVPRHHRVDSRRHRAAEGQQLHGVEARAVGGDGDELHVAVERCVAVPREMLGRGEQAAFACATDKGGDEAADHGRVLAVRADVDDGVAGVVVDVDDRGEAPVDAERSTLAGRHHAGEVRVRFRSRGPDRHRVGNGHDAAADAERHAALHVGGDDQRHRRRILESVQQRRERLDLGLERDHAADLQPADLVEQRAMLRRAAIAVQAKRADADHLADLFLDGHAREGPARPRTGRGRGGPDVPGRQRRSVRRRGRLRLRCRGKPVRRRRRGRSRGEKTSAGEELQRGGVPVPTAVDPAAGPAPRSSARRRERSTLTSESLENRMTPSAATSRAARTLSITPACDRR
jgi:hypothetical protein